MLLPLLIKIDVMYFILLKDGYYFQNFYTINISNQVFLHDPVQISQKKNNFCLRLWAQN